MNKTIDYFKKINFLYKKVILSGETLLQKAKSKKIIEKNKQTKNDLPTKKTS